MRRLSIVQGEHVVVSQAGVVISTLLGSCVAVCLVDRAVAVGGMNHFLLGEPAAGHCTAVADLQRYGVHAMEILINAMLARGAERGRFSAHVYGGANMVAGLGNIGSANAAFARRFLEVERIPIAHAELGGCSARRVEFMPFEGRSRCHTAVEAIIDAPRRSLRPLPTGGELELF